MCESASVQVGDYTQWATQCSIYRPNSTGHDTYTITNTSTGQTAIVSATVYYPSS
jgi:hypothetical protein